MEAIVPLVAILMVFGMPVAIVWIHHHYKHKRLDREAGAEQAATASSGQLLSIAERMERRIDALEQILDAEAPGWRKRHHEHS
jgi:phage shock protein B